VTITVDGRISVWHDVETVNLVRRMERVGARQTCGTERCMRLPDPAVWPALVECRERAVRVALARGTTPNDVDDVVQEAMARVAGMPNVDVSRVGSLLSAVVANLVVDRHRAVAKAVRLEHRLAGVALTQGPLPPDEDVCDRDEARWLWQRARQLTEQDRRILQLRAQGFSVAAAASELGISRKAAENAFARARSKMHALWRSTVSLVGLVWARILGRHRDVSDAVAIALATGTLFVLAVPWRGFWWPSDPGQPARSTSTVEVAPAEARPLSFPSGLVGMQHSPAGRPVAQRADKPSRVKDTAATGPVRLAGVSTSGEHVQRRHEDETLQQTLERCVRKGVTVTLHKVGCNT
jgi:RNA polymerase sigma factor (sigma-70 family)